MLDFNLKVNIAFKIQQHVEKGRMNSQAGSLITT